MLRFPRLCWLQALVGVAEVVVARAMLSFECFHLELLWLHQLTTSVGVALEVYSRRSFVLPHVSVTVLRLSASAPLLVAGFLLQSFGLPAAHLPVEPLNREVNRPFTKICRFKCVW